MNPAPEASETPSISQLIEQALSLDPRRALRFTNGDQARLCTTEVITGLRDDSGQPVTLERVGGKYGALYVRVSTLGQAEDGYSAEDQIRRGIEYFLRHRQAFRIFSDASLSGGLPIAEPSLIRKLAISKASRYEKVFSSIFLYEHSRFTEGQRAGLRGYLEAQKAEILRGINLDPDLTDAQPVVDGFAARHRPSLTILFQSLRQVHTLAVSDLSRLCRSQLLFAELTERLGVHQVAVVGFIESLDFLTQDELGITAFVLSKVAELKLREVLAGTLRGLASLLATGRPHGLLPFWLYRDKDDFARMDAERARSIRRMVDLYLYEGLGHGTIAKQLQREGFAPARGATWSVRYVGYTLANPALVGKQVVFGVEWDVLPALLSAEEWRLLQDRLAGRRSDYPAIRHGEVRLLAGILRCSCGSAIAGNRRSSAKYATYACWAGGVKRMGNPGHTFTVNMGDADRFFDALFREHPAAILTAYRDSRERNALMDEVRALESAARETRLRREAEALNAEETARQRLATASLQPTPDLVRSVVAQLLSSLDTELSELEQLARNTQARLDTLIPEDAVIALEERVQRWDSLATAEKNAVLRTIFEEIRVEGGPGNERLVPYLRTLEGRGGRAIILETTRDQAGRYWRRFPSVDAYIATFYATGT